MKENPTDPDSPIWTAEDFDLARPATEILPPHLASLLVRPHGPSLFAAGVSRQDHLLRLRKLAA